MTSDLVMRGLPDIEQLPPERKDSIVIPADHTQPTDGQRLGRVSLCENESTVVGVSASCLVGIIQLGDTLQGTQAAKEICT